MTTYRITDLLPPALPSAPGYVEAVVSLIWPYSSASDAMSVLLVDSDFRKRNHNGQVRVQLKGPSAVAFKSLEINIGDTVRFALNGARWVEKDTTVTISTPGHDKPKELLFSTRCIFSVERDGLEISRINVDEPNHELYKDPTPPLPSFETPKISRSFEGLKSWHTPWSQTHGTSRSYWEDDPFGVPDEFLTEHPKKRLRFARPSSEWRFVLKDEASPLLSGIDRNQSEHVEQRITPSSVSDDNSQSKRNRGSASPASQSEESLLQGRITDLVLNTALDVQEDIERSSSEAPQTPLAPQLAPLNSPSLPIVSPVTPIASNLLETTVGQMERNTFERLVVPDQSLPNIDSIVELTDKQVELHDDSGRVSRFSPDMNTSALPHLDDLSTLGGLLQDERMHVVDSSFVQLPTDGGLVTDSERVQNQEQQKQVPEGVVDPQRSVQAAHGGAILAVDRESILQAYERTNVVNSTGIITPDASQSEEAYKGVSDQYQPPNRGTFDSNTLITPQASQLELPFSSAPDPGGITSEEGHHPTLLSNQGRPVGAPHVNVDQHTYSPETNSGLNNDNVRTTRSKAKHSNTKLHEVQEGISTSAISPVTTVARRRSSATEPVAMLRQPAIGLRTRSAYYSPLTTMDQHLNHIATENTVDVIAVVTSFTSTPEKAKTGPRDYSTTFHISDPAYYPETLQVQTFRPAKSSLPIANVGDVALLRNFHVRSRKRRCVLVSGESSSWCVWRLASNSSAKKQLGTTDLQLDRELSAKEECNGPPIELDDDERQHAANLSDWWDSKQKESP